ncbi:ParA family protein [Pseudoxanthomonas spadix]|uniref:ParA family protein n=1 Tax=Pseudoxanthomonas spadix TaxID=415229 RepID=UPI000F00B9BC|nr:ParA family protein [Pseudoxanthomonas spadix]MBP3974499.1 ParA family protein [Pseudoxanthomonas spadix]RMW97104.1 ParA family protein [Pseudoxanthomonas spadix]
MSLVKSYAVWNNKGGVGKSTITFHVASRYAEINPEKKVLVIDLCPQSNASMMLLGGGTNGEDAVLGLCTHATPKTVVGYLSTVISGGSGAALPNPFDYLVDVNSHNPNMPENLFLLCGDGNLEPMSPAITQAAGAPALTPTMRPWLWVHQIFRRFIESVVAQDGSEWLVLIDTNPSFAIYTELAMSAADRLVTPVNADDSSRVAANAMFILLHGQVPPHPIYGSWTFAAQAHNHGLSVPKIHVIVGNRLTQNMGPATAFEALSDASAATLFNAYRAHPTYFTGRAAAAQTVDEFKRTYSVPLRDFNTAGIVAAHKGVPLSRLEGGHHQVHGSRVQINNVRVDECLVAVDALVATLT